MSIVEIVPDEQVTTRQSAAPSMPEVTGPEPTRDDVAPVPEGSGQGRVPSPTNPGKPSAPAVGVRPSFTITEAASACAVSRKTITRKLPDLAEHGAAKDDDGVWRIPVEALLAVGLHPGRSVTPTPTPRPIASTPTPGSAADPGSAVRPPDTPPALSHQRADTVTIARDRWDDLRLRLARAEAEASERALALADARLALRALTAGPAQAPMTPVWGQGAVLGQGPLAFGPGAAASVAGPGRSHSDNDPGVDPVPARKRRWWQAAS